MSGMDVIGDDDKYFDDGFDDLPDTTLYELEQNAILSTQRQSEGASRIAFPGNTFKISAIDASHAQGADTRRHPAQSRRANAQPPRNPPYHPPSFYDQETLAGGFLDDSNISTPAEDKDLAQRLAGQDEVAQREQFRLQRFGPSRSQQALPAAPRHQDPALSNPVKNYGQRNREDDDSMLLDSPEKPNITDEGEVAQALRAQIQEVRQRTISLVSH